jgi:hypothetical protein
MKELVFEGKLAAKTTAAGQILRTALTAKGVIQGRQEHGR